MAARCTHHLYCLILLVLIISTALLTANLANAQVPTPPDVPTLGPPVFYDNCSNNQTIISSPVNGQICKNPVTLSFSVTSMGMLGQFGNVGYSLDGGIIYSVKGFSKSVDYNPTNSPAWYYYETSAFASVTLPSLAEGDHYVTVYYGWQYLIPENPNLDRFEVQSMATVNFTVGQLNPPSPTPTDSLSPAPTPTVPELPITAVLVPLVVVLALLVVCRRKLVTKK